MSAHVLELGLALCVGIAVGQVTTLCVVRRMWGEM